MQNDSHSPDEPERQENLVADSVESASDEDPTTPADLDVPAVEDDPFGACAFAATWLVRAEGMNVPVSEVYDVYTEFTEDTEYDTAHYTHITQQLNKYIDIESDHEPVGDESVRCYQNYRLGRPNREITVPGADESHADDSS
jgi:hypothetical protein